MARENRNVLKGWIRIPNMLISTSTYLLKYKSPVFFLCVYVWTMSVVDSIFSLVLLGVEWTWCWSETLWLFSWPEPRNGCDPAERKRIASAGIVLFSCVSVIHLSWPLYCQTEFPTDPKMSCCHQCCVGLRIKLSGNEATLFQKGNDGITTRQTTTELWLPT